NALERPPRKTVRMVRDDILRRRVQPVRKRTTRRLGPEVRPDVVCATPEQQIEAVAVCRADSVTARGGSVGRGPGVVWKTVLIRGMLDHAVQRDVFNKSELSHLNLHGCIPGQNRRISNPPFTSESIAADCLGGLPDRR